MRCNLTIENSAFAAVSSTLQELEISNTNLLESKDFLNNTVKMFKKLEKLSLPNNNIYYIDPEVVPKSVQILKISENNISCNCSNLEAMKELKKRIRMFDFDTLKGCPENTNLTLAEAYEKLEHCYHYSKLGYEDLKGVIEKYFFEIVIDFFRILT